MHKNIARPIAPPSQRVLTTIGSLVIVLLLAAGLTLALLPHAQAFARTLASTCAQAPSVVHCHHQDPAAQGCAADAQIKGQVEIDDANKVTVGFLQLRFSQACNAWWGRVFDTRQLPGAPQKLFVIIAGTSTLAAPTFVNADEHILYSVMIYNPVLQQRTPLSPRVDGGLLLQGATVAQAFIDGYGPAFPG